MMLFRSPAFVKASRFLRALVFTTWVYSTLLWLYIVVRVVVSGVDVHWPFYDSIQGISISVVGTIAFGLSAVAMFVYLWIWGFKLRG
jgi:hypothetical protein